MSETATLFDGWVEDAVASSSLQALYRAAFDPGAVDDVLGFAYVPMSGLAEIARDLARAAPSMLLDAGCGWGSSGLWLRARLGCDLVGIDSSVRAIVHARARAAARAEAVRFLVAPFADTGLPSASVDAVVSIDALHFAPDVVDAAAELLRVVRPGGVLITTTWHVSSGPARLRLDQRTALTEAGWEVARTVDHPDWLEAQLRLYAAASELVAGGSADPAVVRVRDEGKALAPHLRSGQRRSVLARRP